MYIGSIDSVGSIGNIGKGNIGRISARIIGTVPELMGLSELGECQSYQS